MSKGSKTKQRTSANEQSFHVLMVPDFLFLFFILSNVWLSILNIHAQHVIEQTEKTLGAILLFFMTRSKSKSFSLTPCHKEKQNGTQSFLSLF